MHRRNLFGIGFGLVAVLAIAVVAIAVGFNSDAPDASAAGPAPTGIANDGTDGISGVSDILVGDLDTGAGLFYCIIKTDEDSSNNVQTHAQCNIDVPGQGTTGETAPPWSDTDPLLTNPSEPGADLVAGPPPPPPFTVLTPSLGVGTYYPTGVLGCGDGTVACVVTTSCFEDVGSPLGLGPNIVSRVILPTAETTHNATVGGQVDRVSQGTVDIYYNQSNTDCKNFVPSGTPDFAGLTLFSIDVNEKGGTNVNPNPAYWRVANASSTTDFDGDGCTDEQELSQSAKCGDDPQNPSDSFDVNTVDLSGIYDITTRVLRADTGSPGIYFYCRADLQHNTGDNSITVTPYCYSDSIATQVNPEGYPGVTGDGYSGGPPPGACGPQPGPTCSGTFPGDDYAFGDVDPNPTVLSGSLNKGTNNVEIAGCFEDQDGQSPLGNVYVELTASAHQLPGTVDIWVGQTLGDCQTGAAFGSYSGVAGAPTFDNAEVSFVQPNPAKSKGYDQDDDGVPTERELDSTTACGHRDPYNPYDYYDVSIPRDGVIDLPNDILGVILHFAPGGYPAGDENFDRGGSITGSAGSWNRHAPDGVIDLPNDILGVILQFNPGGCAATH